jgi:hypothetical protein
VKFNGKLDLDARLSVSERVTRQLPQFVEKAFTPGGVAGMRQIDFDVNGTLEKPKSNLLERLVGRNYESQAVGLFQSIFGIKKKEQRKEEEIKPPAPPAQDEHPKDDANP